MISLASGLPLLQIGDQEVTDYSPRWLEISIQDAAARAGHDKWWFASDIVKGLFLYLKERFDDTVITIQQLFGKIRGTLEALGFDDIAARLQEVPPPTRVSLEDLADEASSNGGFELQFFQLLSSQVVMASRLGTDRLYLYGLRDAAQKLCGASKWGPNCETMTEEIVAFTENRVASLGNVRALQIS